MRCRGFLLGATAGRTTLNGEGLQHEDGHSHVLASTVPNLVAYDPAFAYELAVILQDGIRRMYGPDVKEDVFYYITLYNENYADAADAGGRERGHPEGAVQAAAVADRGARRREGAPVRQRADPAARAAGAGDPGRAVRRRRRRLERDQLQGAAPRRAGRASAGTSCTPPRSRGSATSSRCWRKEGEKDVFVAASDYMQAVPEMIARWVPGGLFPLGTDGFGRSETRAALRRHFEVDAECITLAALYQLCQQGAVKPAVVQQAMTKLGIDPEKINPMRA